MIHHLVFRMPTPALQSISEIEQSPATGVIKSALIHFPAGSDALVEVAIYHENKKILPDTRYGIALDNATERFMIGEKININEPIEVITKNHDNTYDHTIIVIVEVEET